MPIVIACLLLLTARPASAEPFSFVAVGDTAYNGERDYPVYRDLIKLINASHPAFAIHVGDIWGAGDCSDKSLQRISEFFALYEAPLVYTPGDNEWVDCTGRTLGGFDSQERLRKLRSLFFKDATSLGQARMPIVRQGDHAPAYKAYVENARWEKNGVLFVTLNIPGSNNNFRYDNLASLTEAHERSKAVIAWLRDSFRVARERGSKAVVLAYHAEMFGPPGSDAGPYAAFLREIRIAADRFARPVLLVHGDAHQFKIDRPLAVPQGEGVPTLHANITRLQVFGAPDIKAVRVDVNPDSPSVFGFTPLF